jgi:hypothetical protein
LIFIFFLLDYDIFKIIYNNNNYNIDTHPSKNNYIDPITNRPKIYMKSIIKYIDFKSTLINFTTNIDNLFNNFIYLFKNKLNDKFIVKIDADFEFENDTWLSQLIEYIKKKHKNH